MVRAELSTSSYIKTEPSHKVLEITGSNRLLNQKLAVRVNGHYVLTEKGRLARKLVRIDLGLRNHRNPNVTFAMSDGLLQQHESRMEELSQKLGLPDNSQNRRKRISRYNRQLIRYGYPYWRVSD